jgi:pyrroline-5-carboxylate reductase
MEQTIGFIGAGNMAGALIRGLIRAGVASPERIVASDPSAERRAELSGELGISVETDNLAVAAASDVVVLSVKPQVLPGILPNLRATARERSRLWISVAAGTKTRAIEEGLGGGVRVVRVMPNTPALVGAGATAIARGSAATEDDVRLTTTLFDAVGRTAVLDEAHLDAITGLSGSGPAFVLLVIEALSDGGVRAGLPRAVATSFAAQTVYGTAKLLLETGQHPAALKDAVTSPGGTTITGLEELERQGVRGALIAAVHAATLRSRELGG